MKIIRGLKIRLYEEILKVAGILIMGSEEIYFLDET